MSTFHFHPFPGHLTRRLVAAIEKEFTEVDVTNYREPRGEKRGWFNAPNRGYPFDDSLARRVLQYARSCPHASASDLEKLGGE